MRSILLSAAVFGLAVLTIAVDGCGSGSNSNAPRCGGGSGDSCAATDPICSQPCGSGRQMLCECGVGPAAGMLVCGTCNAIDDGNDPPASGGRSGRGSGGAAASGGRSGRGTGGAMAASGGATAASGGRSGRGSGGTPSASGGSTGTGGGGPITGSGGAVPTVTPPCPADAQGGMASCTATATPICQTACVNGMYNICTCVAGAFLCPSNQITCM